MDSIDDSLPPGPGEAGGAPDLDDVFLEAGPLFGELDFLADFESEFQDSAFNEEDLPADGGEKPVENPVEGGGSPPSLPGGRWSPR